MFDNLTKNQRSKCMSGIRSKWTLPEKRIHAFLKGNRIKHKMHPDLLGNPDSLLLGSKTVVFLQGCFWHKCPNCYVEPKTRKSYWLPKIARNVVRDRKNSRILKAQGYRILKIWEHEIKKDFEKVKNKLILISSKHKK